MPEISDWVFLNRGNVGVWVAVPCLGLALLLPPLFAADSWQHVLLHGAAWLCFLAGALLRYWSTLYLGGRKNDVLVCEGPYSICRNPLYAGTFLLAFSGALFLESIPLAAGALLVCGFYLAATIPAEERMLRARFGPVFDDYCRRTPKLWLRWSHFTSPGRMTIDLTALALECRRSLTWLFLPLLADLLNQARAVSLWPQLFAAF